MGKRRILKIYQSVAYAQRDIPCIMLQGLWLRRLGFETGSCIVVEEGPGRLVIRVLKEANDEYDSR